MQDLNTYLDDDFIVWNDSLGIRDFANIGETKKENEKVFIWFDYPYEMVGPLCLESLILEGQAHFEACTIFTQQKWKDNQKQLKSKAFKKQREQQKLLNEKIRRYNMKKELKGQQKYRELLSLPLSGELKVSEIKIAYKNLAKIEHPDMGGSHERFILILEAKDKLLLKAINS